MATKTSASPQAQTMRMSIRRKAMVYTVSVITLTAVMLTVCAFTVARSLLAQRISAQLSSLVASKEPEIEARLRTDRERTALLGSNTEVINALLGGGSAPLRNLLTALESENVPITGIAVFDANGIVQGVAGTKIAPDHLGGAETTLVPVLGERGWEGHVVFTPVRRGMRGTLAVRYDVERFLESFLSVAYVGETANIYLGRESDGKLTLLNFRFPDEREGVLTLGTAEEQRVYGLPMAEAVTGKEGVRPAEDHRGITTFSAYRSIPSLGWGLVVQVDRSEVLAGVAALARVLIVIAVVTLLLTGVVATALVRRLTDPILLLATNMAKLQPGHWRIARTVQTGDEVELLEAVAADMAKRLKRTYDYMESEIETRTAELRHQYIKDRTILETIDHGVTLVDRDGRVNGANPAALTVHLLFKRPKRGKGGKTTQGL
ncbi:hypothetical protein FJZ28_04325 [Candidatus Peregrinibacteria bacterium]|nr:hypothetical protein [Candidatus Peregrinibacteria bacterium]